MADKVHTNMTDIGYGQIRQTGGTDRHDIAEIDRNDEQGTQTDITVRIQA